MQKEFESIHKQFIDELTLDDHKVSVDDVLLTLTMLPIPLKEVYECEIQEKLPNLEGKKRIKELFYRLNPLFTFVDYELLQHLISRYGSAKLNKCMTSYANSIVLFKSKTTVDDIIASKYWPVGEEDENFKRLRTKFDCNTKTYTLEKLDNFRKRYCNQMKLSKVISVTILKSLEQASSFYAVWLIPTEIAAEMIAAASLVDSSFYMEEGVALVSLDGNILYHAKTKSQLSISQPVAQQLQGLVMKKELSTSLQQLPLPAGTEPVLGRPRSLSLPAMSIQTSTPAHQRPQKANLKQERSASLQELPRELSTEQLFQASSRSRSLSLPELLPSTMAPKIPLQPLPLKWRSKLSSEQPYSLHQYLQGKSRYFYHVYFMHRYKYTCMYYKYNNLSKNFHVQPNNRILLDENIK